MRSYTTIEMVGALVAITICALLFYAVVLVGVVQLVKWAWSL